MEATYKELQAICGAVESVGKAEAIALIMEVADINEFSERVSTFWESAGEGDESGALRRPLAPQRYRILCARDSDQLQRDVNLFLRSGSWYLAGGVSVMTVKTVGSLYTQALYSY